MYQVPFKSKFGDWKRRMFTFNTFFVHYGNDSLNTETSLKEKIEQKSTQLQH